MLAFAPSQAKRRSRGILRRRGGADAAAPAAAAPPKLTILQKMKNVAKSPPGQFLLTEVGKEIRKKNSTAGDVYTGIRTALGLGRHRPSYHYRKIGKKTYHSIHVPKGSYHSKKTGVTKYKTKRMKYTKK